MEGSECRAIKEKERKGGGRIKCREGKREEKKDEYGRERRERNKKKRQGREGARRIGVGLREIAIKARGNKK